MEACVQVKHIMCSDNVYLPVLALTLMTASNPVCLVILLLKSPSSLSASLTIYINKMLYTYVCIQNTAITVLVHK